MTPESVDSVYLDDTVEWSCANPFRVHFHEVQQMMKNLMAGKSALISQIHISGFPVSIRNSIDV